MGFNLALLSNPALELYDRGCQLFRAYFLYLQSFLTWPRCNYFEEGREEQPVNLCCWIGASAMKMFQGPVNWACLYISVVSISTATHILACVVLNFAKSRSLGDLIMQLLAIPFARSRKEILYEEMKSYS